MNMPQEKGVSQITRRSVKNHARHHWTLLLLSMAGAAVVAVHLGQDICWDLLNYHFYAGHAFLHKPFNYDFAPAQVQSFHNPLLQVPTYLLMANLPAKIVAAILGAAQGINFWLLFLISETLFRQWTARPRYILSLINAGTGFYAAANISELGSSMGDNLVSIVVLSGLLLLFRQLASDNVGAYSAWMLFLSGAILGGVAGLKLTTACYAMAAVVALSAVVSVGPKRARHLVVFCGAVVMGFLTTYGLWGTRLYLLYENPVFPYLNNLFRSPYYDFETTMDERFLPRDWVETVFYPFFFIRKNSGLVSEIEFRDARFAFCYLGAIVLAGREFYRLLRNREDIGRNEPRVCANRELLFMFVFFVLSYVIWQQMSSIYRYLAPLELLTPTFVALVVVYLFGRTFRTILICVGVHVAICASVIPFDWGRQPFDNHLLQVQPPQIDGWGEGLVLMTGQDATSYIIPSFPVTTRWVRLSSNLLYPGRNRNLDLRISELISQYNTRRIWVYLATLSETEEANRAMSYYGLRIDGTSFFELKSHNNKTRGYLCRVMKEGPSQNLNSSEAPQSRKIDKVYLEVTPSEAVAGNDTLHYKIIGLNTRAIDVLYTVDGKGMPPVRRWFIDARESIYVPVDRRTLKGRYHIIGIRDSYAPDPNSWIETDVHVHIR